MKIFLKTQTKIVEESLQIGLNKMSNLIVITNRT